MQTIETPTDRLSRLEQEVRQVREQTAGPFPWLTWPLAIVIAAAVLGISIIIAGALMAPPSPPTFSLR